MKVKSIVIKKHGFIDAKLDNIIEVEAMLKLVSIIPNQIMIQETLLLYHVHKIAFLYSQQKYYQELQ